jgi:hypothetical protein
MAFGMLNLNGGESVFEVLGQLFGWPEEQAFSLTKE